MKILESITIKGKTFKNRIMFPPLTTGYEDREGNITEQDIAFYTRLAQGGVGYIVLGDVSPIKSFTPTPKLFEDSQIENFKRLADNIHNYGAKLGVQIFHPEYDCEAVNQLFAEGKMQEIRGKMQHDMQFFTDEVSEEMLLLIIDQMCACAVRAHQAGVDAVQIHGDRLVGTLCGTKMNHRTDKFGGSLKNRTRFALMLVKAMRQAVPDMILDYKLSVVTPERGKGGVDEQDAPVFAKWLEEAGVDMLHVAQANHTGNMADTIPPMGVQPYGFFVHIADQVKKAVKIPVSTVGRIVDPSMAEMILTSKKADMIGLGRPLLADPDWVKKAEENRVCDIRRCIYCNKGCTDNIQNRAFLACVLNAENGYEGSRKITPAKTLKKVIITGGGPAGMEAARVAAAKGHRVILFEKAKKLGGQLNLACIPPRKEEMRRAIQDMEYQIKKAGITLLMAEEATQEKILALEPDVVILAVGASNMIPSIPGSDKVHVLDAWKVLAGEESAFGKAVVIGGGMVGCETAEYLAQSGCDVAVVEMLDKIAAGESGTILPTMMENYSKYNVKQYPSHRVESIQDDHLICRNSENEIVQIPCDFVVMAAGAAPRAFTDDKLKEKGIQVIRIGDCMERALDISHAITSGYEAGNSLM